MNRKKRYFNQEEINAEQLTPDSDHDIPLPNSVPEAVPDLYAYHDRLMLHATRMSFESTHNSRLSSIDELIERDNQREKDGFPRKIRLGRLIKPGRRSADKMVIVPTTVEEKFLHDRSPDASGLGGGTGGSGEGEEGDVVGEQPVRGSGREGAQGPGQGEGGPHELESNAYDLGRILTEKFKLPNLKDKGKKRFLSRYTYDLTDRNEGSGQFLDKKATLRKILETNIGLGKYSPTGPTDPSGLLIAPRDMVYRILSKEKDYESQALVFFIRDYSGSMTGKTTELVVAQHVLIYSWLLYQYRRQVETRFILHDTEAKEVPDFYTYYNSGIAGGTKVASAYRLVNTIIREESLAADYNIYLFHGTDGDDWDSTGSEALPEIETLLTYTNRVGITIAEHADGSRYGTEMERYLKTSGLLEQREDLLRLDVIREDADEGRLIEGIKALISE